MRGREHERRPLKRKRVFETETQRDSDPGNIHPGSDPGLLELWEENELC